MGQFTFSFFFSYFLLLGILVFQAVAEGSTTTSTLSLAYPRKIMVHRVLLSTTSTKSNIADPPEKSNTEGENEGEKGASIGEAPESTIEREHHHSDKSVAGGGVIIGGLVTAIFAVVYCYIRVTRKRDGDQ
ncbi:hypothetical protein A4A49_14708 [Nicotiana attenuata]|uniref:Transmembrane protein n=1 Tax=Nicotiana attenuata TaxID=49451 RepID=A0A1J6ISM6_NICAT|nr:hypothetical protein A4A49_14708 [Nicotiana attenuata]